ncbi:MAG: hypothetical protein J6Q96_03415 [Bacteroidales bacterium]|nr:hypothetical protein [Bacteroidales bacterium]
MDKKNKNFTIIDWEAFQYIKTFARSGKDLERKPSYSELLIIFYIRGFGEQGYYGSQASLGSLLGMSQEQISRSLKTIFDTIHYRTYLPILYKRNNTIYFNESFLDYSFVEQKPSW